MIRRGACGRACTIHKAAGPGTWMSGSRAGHGPTPAAARPLYCRAMSDDCHVQSSTADQQRFCVKWLEARGIRERPTLDQLMDMSEAYAAHRLQDRGSLAQGPA